MSSLNNLKHTYKANHNIVSSACVGLDIDSSISVNTFLPPPVSLFQLSDPLITVSIHFDLQQPYIFLNFTLFR